MARELTFWKLNRTTVRRILEDQVDLESWVAGKRLDGLVYNMLVQGD